MTHQTTFASGINPFERLGKMPAKLTMQTPTKPKRVDERYSRPPVATPAPVLKVSDAPASKRTMVYVAPNELSITNDALPACRALPVNKYHAVFDGMKMGQSVRCPTASVGKVCGAMRKFIEVKGLRAHVKSMTRFEDDTGYGRVWMMETPAKALKVAA